MQTRRLTLLAILVTLASVLHFLEAIIPLPLPVPGVKFGFANTVTLCTIVLLGFSETLWVAVLRVILGSLLSGYLLSVTFAMSLAGSLFSAVAMYTVFKLGRDRLSLISVSICGAVVHNLAQLTVAAGLVQTTGVFAYLPYLLFFALPTGFLTGFISTRLVKHLQVLPGFKSS